MSFEIGARVETENFGKGKVAFCGSVHFLEGEMVGVILDEPKGKNDGTVKGTEYFKCEPNYGLMIRPQQCKLEGARPSVSASRTTGLKAPTAASQLRKESVGSKSKLSPGSSPGMSPAPSVERLTRGAAPSVQSSKKTASTANSPRETATEKRKIPSTSRLVEKAVVPSATPSPKQSIAKASAPPPITIPEPEIVNNNEESVNSPSVMTRVKKLQETPLAAPPLIPTGMDEGTEKEYLRAEVKDLTEKLETLRVLRRDDRAKLVEFDRVQIQLQAMMEAKQKGAELMLDLQRQLQETKREASEHREWRLSNQDEISSAQELLEMATIDKEMAEEKAELLQGECESLKEKMEEMEAELEILKEEMAQADGGGGGVATGNSVQMKQIEQQNERLKEALVKLRDANGMAMSEKQAAVKEAEALRTENNELMRAFEIAKKTSDESSRSIQELQEQVDALLEAEQMVSALTSKNLDLEDKIAKLEQDLEDLESLRDMDEQIQEAQKQVEKDLLKDIEEREMNIQEFKQKLVQEEKHADELSHTIVKFRKKVSELNEEIQDIKDQVLRYEDELNIQRTEDKDMAGMVTQMNMNATKTFAEKVDSSVKSIELDFAGKHVNLLKAFLPDNFSKAGGDNDSVILSVLFPRLSSKASLLRDLVKDKFPGVPGGMRREHITKSHKAEQWAHAAKVAHFTAALIAVCGQFESSLLSCTMERLSRVAQMQLEMSGQEKVIDSYIDLLKQGRFDENTSLDGLARAVVYFQNVFGVHMSGESFDASKWTSSILQQMLNSFSWWKVNSQRVNFLMLPGSEDCDVSQFVTQVGTEMVECEQLVMKAIKRVPDEKERTLKLTPQFTDDISSAIVHLERVVNSFHEACGLASGQIGMMADNDGLEPSRVKEMFHAVTEKIYGSITMEKTFEPYSKYLWTLRENLSSIHSQLDGGLMEVENSSKKPFPPILERAMARKQAAADAEGLKWQLEKKDGEIMDLKKNVKARIDDVSNYKLRLEMAEKRVESSGKAEGVRVQHLDAKVDQLVSDMKKKQIEFDEALDSLQRELLASERENSELKEMAKNFSKKALLHGMQSMEVPRSPSQSSISSHLPSINNSEVAFMDHQVNDLQQQLRFANQEIQQLKCDNISLSSRGGSLSLPVTVCGPQTLAYQNEKRAKEVQYLDEILEEGYRLKRDEFRFWFFRPDYSKPEKSIASQKEEWEKERRAYLHKIDSLRARARHFWNETEPGEPLPTIFSAPIGIPQIPESSIQSKQFQDVCKKWGIKAA